MRDWTSAAFTLIWIFELIILVSPATCGWVPYCSDHKIWYLGGGFLFGLVLTLINFHRRFSGSGALRPRGEGTDADSTQGVRDKDGV